MRVALARRSRASPSSTRGPSQSVVEERQGRRRGADGILDAEGFERVLRQAQRVFDGLVRDVALEVVLDELRQHALDSAGVARLEQLGRSGDGAIGACGATARRRARRARRRSRSSGGRRATRALPRSGPLRPADRSHRPRRAPGPARPGRARRSWCRSPRRPRGHRADPPGAARSASRPPSESWQAALRRRARPRPKGSTRRCRP